MKNGIIICSGGIDSVTAAFYAKKKLNYDNLIVLFFNYGQKSLNAERKAAKKCSSLLKSEFIEISLPELSKISTSLINRDGESIIKSRKELKDTKKESKLWYVPCRNSIFITYALAIAEAELIKKGKKYDIFLGFKCEGKDSFPDTTLEYLKLMNSLIAKTSISRFKILAPLIKKDKEDIIILGKKLGIRYENTHSCYVGNKNHCGKCLACMLRKEGFYWANLNDPTIYAE